MYIETLTARNFRTFRDTNITFIHAGTDFERLGMKSQPRYPNLNLVLGANGQGKSSLLKAISLTALGPAVQDSGIFPYHLVRREPAHIQIPQPLSAKLVATFVPHPQDGVARHIKHVESQVTVTRRGDLEQVRWTHEDDKPWHPIFSAESDAFFFVGYSSNRRVESSEKIDPAARRTSAFARAQRIRGLFEEAHSLVPLTAWLPRYQLENPGRFTQVVDLIDRLLKERSVGFEGKRENGEYLFDVDGLSVPFPALSDGYRAFLGWVGDLLYHVCETCPRGKKLADNRGFAMIDEIDLHLHPEWQMSILPTLAECLPNLQFILTSHSPLLVGSLEWMNILVVRVGEYGSSTLERISEPVHGMDADQVLLTDYFGLETTRAPSKASRLRELTLQARTGSTEAARDLLIEMSRGTEPGA